MTTKSAFSLPVGSFDEAGFFNGGVSSSNHARADLPWEVGNAGAVRRLKLGESFYLGQYALADLSLSDRGDLGLGWHNDPIAMRVPAQAWHEMAEKRVPNQWHDRFDLTREEPGEEEAPTEQTESPSVARAVGGSTDTAEDISQPELAAPSLEPIAGQTWQIAPEAPSKPQETVELAALNLGDPSETPAEDAESPTETPPDTAVASDGVFDVATVAGTDGCGPVLEINTAPAAEETAPDQPGPEIAVAEAPDLPASEAESETADGSTEIIAVGLSPDDTTYGQELVDRANANRGEGLADPSLAVGLSGFAYYKSPPFLNLMKQAFNVGIRDANGDAVTAETLAELGYLDENGYPTRMFEGNASLPVWQQGYEYGLALHQTNEEVKLETAGTFVVEWAGEGTITLRDFNVHSTEILRDASGQVTGGRMTGEWSADAPLKYVRILDTDPNSTGNHLRDISVVKAEYKDLYDVGAIFNPEYIALIEDHHTIRFLDWMEANGSDVKAVADVLTVDAAVWLHGDNVTAAPEISSERLLDRAVHLPFEVMVQLANEIGADPWFTIPLKASDDYVRALARHVDENLDDGLLAKFELSNEVWNWAGGFEQTREASLLGTDGESSTNIQAARQYYGYRSAQIREIFDEEARTVDAEVILGTQTAYHAVTQWVEEGVDRYFAEIGGTGEMSDVFGALAVTGYFGGIEYREFEALRDHWYEVSEQRFQNGLEDSKHSYFVARAADYLANGLGALSPGELSLVERRSDGTFEYHIIDPMEGFLRDNLAANKEMADNWGLELIQYEGGSHIAPGSYQGDPEAEWYRALNKSDAMAELIARMADIFREEGGTLVNDYGNLGDLDFGLWGTRTSLSEENPISTVYDHYNETASERYGSINDTRDSDAFLQGVTLNGSAGGDVLIGTAKRDYLLGGDGADIFAGGASSDGINGGDGVDIALFSGAIENAGIYMDGDLLIVSDGTQEDRLINVELIAFAGSQQIYSTSQWTQKQQDVTVELLIEQFEASNGAPLDLF